MSISTNGLLERLFLRCDPSILSSCVEYVSSIAILQSITEKVPITRSPLSFFSSPPYKPICYSILHYPSLRVSSCLRWVSECRAAGHGPSVSTGRFCILMILTGTCSLCGCLVSSRMVELTELKSNLVRLTGEMTGSQSVRSFLVNVFMRSTIYVVAVSLLAVVLVSQSLLSFWWWRWWWWWCCLYYRCSLCP